MFLILSYGVPLGTGFVSKDPCFILPSAFLACLQICAPRVYMLLCANASSEDDAMRVQQWR